MVQTWVGATVKTYRNLVNFSVLLDQESLDCALLYSWSRALLSSVTFGFG